MPGQKTTIKLYVIDHRSYGGERSDYNVNTTNYSTGNRPLPASVASDIFSYLEPGAISGLISAAGIPYLGLTDVNTPLSLTYVPGMLSTDNVTLYATSKAEFVNSLFDNPPNVPVEVKWSWLGATAQQLPTIAALLVARAQNATELYLAGATGFPLMLLYGTADAVLQDEVIISQVAPHFTNVQIYTIQGGSHAVFYGPNPVKRNTLMILVEMMPIIPIMLSVYT